MTSINGKPVGKPSEQDLLNQELEAGMGDALMDAIDNEDPDDDWPEDAFDGDFDELSDGGPDEFEIVMERIDGIEQRITAVSAQIGEVAHNLSQGIGAVFKNTEQAEPHYPPIELPQGDAVTLGINGQQFQLNVAMLSPRGLLNEIMQQSFLAGVRAQKAQAAKGQEEVSDADNS